MNKKKDQTKGRQNRIDILDTFISFTVQIVILMNITMLYLNIYDKVEISNFVEVIFWGICGPCFVLLGSMVLINKIISIPKKKLIIEKSNTQFIIEWVGKYRFKIIRLVTRVDRHDFGQDVNGKLTSYIDRIRIFASLYEYRDKLYRDMKKTTLALQDINEKSIGVRNATDFEINILNKRIEQNRLLLVAGIILINILFLFVALSYSLVCFEILISAIIVTIIFALIYGHFVKIFKVKDEKYLIIECDIIENIYVKFDRIRRSENSSGIKRYIRCVDKNKMYIDKWFECDKQTFVEKKAQVVLVKRKDGKVYINSYDKMWFFPYRAFKQNLKK